MKNALLRTSSFRFVWFHLGGCFAFDMKHMERLGSPQKIRKHTSNRIEFRIQG